MTKLYILTGFLAIMLCLASFCLSDSFNNIKNSNTFSNPQYQALIIELGE